MEAYKALCERRILDFDPNHQMPVMPYHLGQSINDANYDEISLNNNTADLKRLLALKEQDLLYSKQRNEKLIREIEELKNSGKNIGNQSNFEALRKEIELNEKLQKQVELQQEQIQKLKNLENQNKNSVSPSKSTKSQRSENENNGMMHQIKVLRQQLESLNEEKNALLDYIEENVDKSNPLTDRLKVNEENQKLKDDYQELFNQNLELKQKYEKELQKNNDYKIQLEKALKNNYQSPNFTGTQKTIQDQEKYTNNQAENTFGLDQFHNILSDHNRNKQNNQVNMIENQQMIEKDNLKEKYMSVQQENEQLKLKIKYFLMQDENVKDGNVSNRTQRSNSGVFGDNKSDRAFNSTQKQVIKELETKLKATQENSKTLSQTLNETQAELDQLQKDYQQLSQDYKNQLDENQKLYSLLQKNQKYLETLQLEKDKLQIDYQQVAQMLNKQENKDESIQEQKSKEKEHIERLENHIRELKQEQQKQVNQVSQKWEETVGELTKDLENTKIQILKRQEMFQNIEVQYQRKIEYYEKGCVPEKSNLEKRIEELQQEIKQLQSAKIDKDTKLKNQIRKNEELLGELQELSEAVNALKNDRELTIRSEIITQKQNIIDDMSDFLQNNQKKTFDKIFQNLLKFADFIRDFYKYHKLQPFNIEQEFLKQKDNCSKNEEENNQNQVFPQIIFDQLDRNLKSVAEMQIQWQQNQKRKTNQQSNESDFSNQMKLEKDIKIMNQLLKDLESLYYNLMTWNQGMVENYKQKIVQLNETQKNLQLQSNETRNLKDQIDKLMLEETQIVERDRQIENELKQMNQTIKENEKQMQDQYKREDKLGRQNQKLRTQLDNMVKEYEKLSKHVYQLIKEKDDSEKQCKEQNDEVDRLNDQIRVVEYQNNSMQEYVQMVNQMVRQLQKSMPSNQLSQLVAAMQDHIHQTFKFNQQFSFTENNLLNMENELKQLSKTDTVISQNVINLRKNIEKNRKELKMLQIKKIEMNSNNENILDNLRNIEQIEKRRHEVSLETEKSLAESKNKIQEMKREVVFANNSKKDMELVIYGIQQQNQLLERELTSLRQQFAQGNFNQINQTATLGNALAKMKSGQSLATFSSQFHQNSQKELNFNCKNPLQEILIENTSSHQMSSRKNLVDQQCGFNYQNNQNQLNFGGETLQRVSSLKQLEETYNNERQKSLQAPKRVTYLNDGKILRENDEFSDNYQQSSINQTNYMNLDDQEKIQTNYNYDQNLKQILKLNDWQQNKQFDQRNQHQQNKRNYQSEISQINQEYLKNEFKDNQNKIFFNNNKDVEGNQQIERETQNECTFSPLRQRSMSAGFNRGFQLYQRTELPRQQTLQSKMQAASLQDLQQFKNLNSQNNQINYQQDEFVQRQQNYQQNTDVNMIEPNKNIGQHYQLQMVSDPTASEKSLHLTGALQIEANNYSKLPPFPPKSTSHSFKQQNNQNIQSSQINEHITQKNSDIRNELFRQASFQNANNQYGSQNSIQQYSDQQNKIQRSQSAYQQDYGTFGGKMNLRNQQIKQYDFKEYLKQNIDQNQDNKSSQKILNYPSMQNIHTSQSNNNENQTLDENTNNLFSFPGSSNSNQKNQAMFIQNDTSRDYKYDFDFEVNLKQKQISNQQSQFYQQNNQILPNTPSLTTNKTEIAKQVYQIEHANLTDSKQSETIQGKNEVQNMIENQNKDIMNLNKINFSNIHRKMNSFDSEQNDGLGKVLDEVDNKRNRYKSDDLPEPIDDKLENSLIKSFDELQESSNEYQTSQQVNQDHLGYKKSDLQKKLYQVINVFSSIRQNLNEASTVQDQANSSLDQTLID